MNRTSDLIGKDEGREEGVELGRRKRVVEFLEAQLVARFGPLPAEALDKLRRLPDVDLTRIGITFHTVPSLADLGL